MISWRRKLTICVAGPAGSPSCRPRSPQRSVVVALGALSRHSDTDTRDLRSVRPTATTRKRPDMLTMTRGAFMQAKVRCRCAVVALWSEHEAEYTPGIRRSTANLRRSYGLRRS